MEPQGFFVVLCLFSCALAGKYSREVNEPKAVDGDGRTLEFRIAKLNQVWEKAIRVSLSSQGSRGSMTSDCVVTLAKRIKLIKVEHCSVLCHSVSRPFCEPALLAA